MTLEIQKENLSSQEHDQLHYHIQRDPHLYTNSLADVILGGQDGLVNVLGIVLGVAAATSDPRIVLVAGLAATFAESVSMAAVAYTSTLAETSHYESEREREYRHVRMVPGPPDSGMDGKSKAGGSLTVEGFVRSAPSLFETHLTGYLLKLRRSVIFKRSTIAKSKPDTLSTGEDVYRFTLTIELRQV